MNRTGLTLSAVLATIGAAKILFPSTLANLFALDTEIALFALAIVVLAYGVWFGPLKFLSGSWMIKFLGFIIIATGLTAISSPTLWGTRESFVPIADIFVVIEAGIMLQLIGLEKKQVNALSPLVYVSLTWQLLHRRWHRGQTSPPVTTYISH